MKEISSGRFHVFASRKVLDDLFTQRRSRTPKLAATLPVPGDGRTLLSSHSVLPVDFFGVHCLHVTWAVPVHHELLLACPLALRVFPEPPWPGPPLLRRGGMPQGTLLDKPLRPPPHFSIQVSTQVLNTCTTPDKTGSVFIFESCNSEKDRYGPFF